MRRSREREDRGCLPRAQTLDTAHYCRVFHTSKCARAPRRRQSLSEVRSAASTGQKMSIDATAK